uniref:Uncharacterized protein n=1 Tax=Anopheles minimus TaxID=112268 RepID=A0A182W052_9DIPT
MPNEDDTTFRAEGLSCKFCQSVNNYNSCLSSAGLVECNGAMVNMTHLLLNPHNPSLGKMPPSNQYQCFQVNYTTNGVWNYHMGCSFASGNICAGWKVLSHCKLSNGNEGQISSVKMPDKLIPKMETSAATGSGVSNNLNGKTSTQAATRSPTGLSTTTISIAMQSNSSSTLPPKTTPNPKNSNQRKTPSKARLVACRFLRAFASITFLIVRTLNSSFDLRYWSTTSSGTGSALFIVFSSSATNQSGRLASLNMYRLKAESTISRRIFFPVISICPSASSFSLNLIFFALRTFSEETISNPPSLSPTVSTVLCTIVPIFASSGSSSSDKLLVSLSLDSPSFLSPSCFARRRAFFPGGSLFFSSFSAPSTFTPAFLYASINLSKSSVINGLRSSSSEGSTPSSSSSKLSSSSSELMASPFSSKSESTSESLSGLAASSLSSSNRSPFVSRLYRTYIPSRPASFASDISSSSTTMSGG